MINTSTILPANLRHQYLLCYIKHYLEDCEEDKFTSNEIAESIDGIFSNQIITRLLSRYNFKSKGASVYNPNGANTFYRYYVTKKVLNVLQQLDIYSFNLNQLKKALTAKSATKVSKTSTFSAGNGGSNNSTQVQSTHLYSPLDYLFETYTEEDIEIYNKITDFNFYYYYYFVQALKDIVEIEGNHILIPDGFTTDRDGYPLLDQKLLNYLELPIDISLFDTDRISRIVTQVYNPLLDYSDLHGHHIRCKEHYNCINPMHLTPAVTHLHAKYHNMERKAVGINHPILNPKEHFQVVEITPTVTIN